jgi:enoyl-CoA hydratase/carnithine racemase
MSTSTVLYECEGGIAVITLNRPERLNAFNAALFADLNAAIARFRDDAAAQVCILTAAGDRAFSAGMDIDAGDALLKGGDLDAASQFEFDFTDDNMGGKPVIFAAFGHCVGQAVALAAWADIRIAADTTQFALPEAKLGVNAVLLPVLLTDLIGGSQAAYALIYGGRLGADWALRSGFVHEVVTADAVMTRAREIAGEIMKQGPMALRAHKRLLLAARREDRAAVIAKGLEMRQATLRSADFREGISAFLERRDANFKGR